MTGTQALQSVQFVTVKGKRLAVLPIEDWEAMVEWLETVEDIQLAQQALIHLKSAGGDRKKAGWIGWNEAEKRTGMSQYRVYITPEALAEIKDLPGNIRLRVRRTVKSLTKQAFPAQSKQLKFNGPDRQLCRIRLDN